MMKRIFGIAVVSAIAMVAAPQMGAQLNLGKGLSALSKTAQARIKRLSERAAKDGIPRP